MKTIQATYNAGRWIAKCPKCNEGAVLVENVSSGFSDQSKHVAKNEYICPVCYPGSVAQFPGLVGRTIALIPDKSARKTARKMAEENDDIYQVTFPQEKEQIEKLLEKRPHTKRNWDGPHETLEFLERENHIMENFQKRRMVLTPEELGVKVVRK